MNNNGKPPAQVIGLNTLKLSGTAVMASKVVSVPYPASKKRVFTDEQWQFLNTLSNQELFGRIGQGYHLIGLLYRPEMLNMNGPKADMVSSNLRFQIDAIWTILEARGIKRNV